jgi:hypothetical protein
MPPKKFKVREPEPEPPKPEEPKRKKVFKTQKNVEAASKIQSFLKRAIEKRKARKVVSEEKRKKLLKNYKETNDIFMAFASAVKSAELKERSHRIKLSILDKYEKSNSYYPISSRSVIYDDADGLAIYQEFLEEIEEKELGERALDFAEFWFHEFVSSYGRSQSGALKDLQDIMKGIRTAVLNYGKEKPRKPFRTIRVEPPYGPDISLDSLQKLSDMIPGFTLEFYDELDIQEDERDDNDGYDDESPYEASYYVYVY